MCVYSCISVGCVLSFSSTLLHHLFRKTHFRLTFHCISRPLIHSDDDEADRCYRNFLLIFSFISVIIMQYHCQQLTRVYLIY